MENVNGESQISNKLSSYYLFVLSHLFLLLYTPPLIFALALFNSAELIADVILVTFLPGAI